jgi:hypothetical protein
MEKADSNNPFVKFGLNDKDMRALPFMYSQMIPMPKNKSITPFSESVEHNTNYYIVREFYKPISKLL